MARDTHAFCFAGRDFQALPERALWWPERRALLVADLHLEKGSWFAARGQMLPPFDSDDTLERLSRLAATWQPAEIWALGDSFHDDHGPGRLSDAAMAMIARLAEGRRFVWITGNHDDAAAMPGERIAMAMVDGIVLRHEADPAETRPEISGHFHPKLRLRGRPARPCFAVSPGRLILPAFGALTGGMDVADPVVRGRLGHDAAALVPTRERLLRFPVGACAPLRQRHKV